MMTNILCLVRPLYVRAPHPRIQPTTDGKIFEKILSNMYSFVIISL
jgi:hypothetical protein